MVLINYSDKTVNCKIVYYGPQECGKTSNLKYIYNQLGSNIKGKLFCLEEADEKTAFFDYLLLDLGQIKGFNIKFSLYSTSGQEKLNAARSIILNGTDGVVFVADSTPDRIQENLSNFKNLEENLKSYEISIDKIPLIFQYNKRDLENALPLEQLERDLNKNNYPSFEAVAAEGTGVFACLKAISSSILTSLQ